jgi:hypothetical protein
MQKLEKEKLEVNTLAKFYFHLPKIIYPHFFFFVWEYCTTKTEKSMTLFYLLSIQGAKKNTQLTVDANCKPEMKNLIMYVQLFPFRKISIKNSLLYATRSFEFQT